MLRFLGLDAPRQVGVWLIPGIASLAVFAYLLTLMWPRIEFLIFSALGT